MRLHTNHAPKTTPTCTHDGPAVAAVPVVGMPRTGQVEARSDQAEEVRIPGDNRRGKTSAPRACPGGSSSRAGSRMRKVGTSVWPEEAGGRRKKKQ